MADEGESIVLPTVEWSKLIGTNGHERVRGIKVDGIALENGDFNDKIKVKNISSGEILTGFVNNNKKVIFRPKQF